MSFACYALEGFSRPRKDSYIINGVYDSDEKKEGYWEETTQLHFFSALVSNILKIMYKINFELNFYSFIIVNISY